jgi:hypothetical protein
MIQGEIKVGDRLLWKPGTQDFRRCTVKSVGPVVELLTDSGYTISPLLEDVMKNCERAVLDTGIKPL